MGALIDSPGAAWAVAIVMVTALILTGWVAVVAAWSVLYRYTTPIAKGLSYFFMYIAMAGDRADAELIEQAQKVTRR